eukprot:scaffold176407_cov20-Tisochrysis_lutea.AAC.1
MQGLAGSILLSRLYGFEIGKHAVLLSQSGLSTLTPSNPPSCGLLRWSDYTVVSSRVVLDNNRIEPAAMHGPCCCAQNLFQAKRHTACASCTSTSLLLCAVHISGNRIVNISLGGDISYLGVKVLNFGDAVISPGVIDVHAHLNEPGREDWEEGEAGPLRLSLLQAYVCLAFGASQPQAVNLGFWRGPFATYEFTIGATSDSADVGISTGTAAAAVGGITTLTDMPLNSFPATTNTQLLKKKQQLAEMLAAGQASNEEKAHVGVSHWAGPLGDDGMLVQHHGALENHIFPQLLNASVL